MPRISMTDFVDIVSASGTPKATKVRNVKDRPPYTPAFDFWRGAREAIIATHANADSKRELSAKLRSFQDPRKASNYEAALRGYKRWWGRKELSWFKPAGHVYSKHGIDVSVNPELGLEINGERHLVKLYFKAEALAKNRVDILTHLMKVKLGPASPECTVMSVLDIRRARLISPTVPVAALTASLDAELAYVAALWESI